MEDDSFVKCLENARDSTKNEGLDSQAALQLLEKEESKNERLNGEEAEGLSEGWELVEKEEVLDAMALFIAAYIQVSAKNKTHTPTHT